MMDSGWHSSLLATLTFIHNCSYNVIVKIEWDRTKSTTNKRKHGLSFEEAAGVFDDPLHLSLLDERFDRGEERWITLGQIHDHMIIVAAHTYMDSEGNETVRIISARRATGKEERWYRDYEI